MLKNSFQVLKTARKHRKHWRQVWKGLKQFRETGETPEEAYQSLIALHCATNGYSNDFLHDLNRMKSRPQKLPNHRGVLGDLSAQDVKAASDQICDQGYVAFQGRVPRLVCDALTDFAKTHDAPISPAPENGPSRAIFDPANPLGPAYWFDENDLVKAQVVQDLMCDYSIISVVQAYLRCLPVLDIVGMWWSAAQPRDKNHQGLCGQLYHFDMNRIKWLKVMFYLTDVDHSGGPHCFVPGTHRPGTQPPELLQRGYARIPDEDINKYYPGDRQHEIVGPRGTILFADTRAFHKGKTPEMNERLVFQLNYCDSLFGAAFDRPEIPLDCTPELNAAADRFPKMYARYKRSTHVGEQSTRKAA